MTFEIALNGCNGTITPAFNAHITSAFGFLSFFYFFLHSGGVRYGFGNDMLAQLNNAYAF